MEFHRFIGFLSNSMHNLEVHTSIWQNVSYVTLN